ncbi:MAG: response regulator [Cyanobacteria bacterium P01_H01_bin.105]
MTILLIEDSPTDAAILEAAFEQVGCQRPIQLAQTGDEALGLLKDANHDTYSSSMLILLDLNLPGTNGYDVLQTIKQNSVWQIIPTIILSSSNAPHDIEKSYRLHANAYITKPANFTGYTLIAQKIYDFWLNTAKLPVE